MIRWVPSSSVPCVRFLWQQLPFGYAIPGSSFAPPIKWYIPLAAPNQQPDSVVETQQRLAGLWGFPSNDQPKNRWLDVQPAPAADRPVNLTSPAFHWRLHHLGLLNE